MLNQGLLFALIAYFIWGLLPLFWKQLAHVNDLDILAHRVIWATAFMVCMNIAYRWRRGLRDILRSPKALLQSGLASILVAWNWWFYIYAVNGGHIVETSMGYFINPLISVLFAALFLKESLRPMQWLCIAIAAAGVIYLVASYGSVPYIALTLAVSFSLYGIVKKAFRFPAINGMTVETTLLAVPALIFLMVQLARGETAYVGSFTTLWLLVLAGPLTVLPLIFFAAATQKMSFALVGICQYVAPTLQLLIGTLVYHEVVERPRWIAFCLIWFALIVFTIESLVRSYRQKQAINREVA